MKSTILFFVLIVSAQIASAQNPQAYQLYNSKGKVADFDRMIKDLSKQDMVFFGEYHDNAIAHWMQLEVCKGLYELKKEDLYMGAEMFESGNQLVMDEYLKGLYPEDKMIPEMTQMWSNYKTDYKPLLDFAKDKGLSFIATNIPRRYASLIYKKGLDGLRELTPEALALISPHIETYFDPTEKAYAEMADKMGGHVPSNMFNIQAAQASKDATMAYFSIENFKPKALLLHFQGSYHSNYNQGIIWWIHKTKPGFKIKSITTLLQSEWDIMSKEESAEIANYILVVPDEMTRTY